MAISRNAFSLGIVALIGLAYGATKIDWDRADKPEYWLELAQRAGKYFETAPQVLSNLRESLMAPGYMRDIIGGVEEAGRQGPDALNAYYKKARADFAQNPEAQTVLFNAVMLATAPQNMRFGFGNARFLVKTAPCHEGQACWFDDVVEVKPVDLSFTGMAPHSMNVVVCYEPSESSVAINRQSTYLTDEQVRRLLSAPARPEMGKAGSYSLLPRCGELMKKQL